MSTSVADAWSGVWPMIAAGTGTVAGPLPTERLTGDRWSTCTPTAGSAAVTLPLSSIVESTGVTCPTRSWRLSSWFVASCWVIPTIDGTATFVGAGGGLNTW